MRLDTHDHAVVLCVDRRYASDWPRVRALLNERGVEPTCFLDGDGRMLGASLYDQTTLPVPPSWTHGQGAYQHFAAMQAVVRCARDEGWGSVLWAEDDLVLRPDFDRVVAEAEVPGDWALLYYGANHSGAITEVAGARCLRVRGSTTTHLLAIRESAYDAILRLRPVHVIDRVIADTIQRRMPCYAIWPNEARQRAGRSFLWHQDVDYDPMFDSMGANRR